jgi:hypothetical protein
VVEWWSGGVVEWWSGGVVEWWSGGVVEWWSGVGDRKVELEKRLRGRRTVSHVQPSFSKSALPHAFLMLSKADPSRQIHKVFKQKLNVFCIKNLQRKFSSKL